MHTILKITPRKSTQTANENAMKTSASVTMNPYTVRIHIHSRVVFSDWYFAKTDALLILQTVVGNIVFQQQCER